MAGEAAAFRSLTPEVQQRIARRMVAGNPLNSAFVDALQMAQTSDFAAKGAMQIHDAMFEEYDSGQGVADVISYGIEDELEPSQALPLPPEASATQSLPPTSENPPYGEEFETPFTENVTQSADPRGRNRSPSGYEGDDLGLLDILTDNPAATATAAGLGAGAIAAREIVKNRRRNMPNVVAQKESGADLLDAGVSRDDAVERAIREINAAEGLEGGQQRGQMNLFDDSVDLNEPLAPNRTPHDPRQTEMALGDPRQMELDLNPASKPKVQPLTDSTGKQVGFVQYDANGMAVYSMNGQYLGSTLEEVQKNMPMPPEVMEAGKPKVTLKSENVPTTVKDVPDEVIEEAIIEPKRKTKRGSRKKTIAGYDDIPNYKGTGYESITTDIAESRPVKGGQNVSRLDDYSIGVGDKRRLTQGGKDELQSNIEGKYGVQRKQRAKDAARYVDTDIDNTGEIQRVVTNADGTKTAFNADHPRWASLDVGSKQLVVDTETGMVYDNKGFQITDTVTLQRLKNTLGTNAKYIGKGSKKSLRNIASTIKIVF